MPDKEKQADAQAASAAKGKKDKGKAEEKKVVPPPPPPTPYEVLSKNIAMLDKYAESRDPRLLSRVLRYTNFLRKHLPLTVLRQAIDITIPDLSRKAALSGLIDRVASKRVEPAPITAPTPAAAEDSKAEGKIASPASSKIARVSSNAVHEVEVYLMLFCLSLLAANEDWEGLASASVAAVDYIAVQNKRTLDFFEAKIYSYLSLAYERRGNLAAIRPALLAAHRTASLRHDEYSQAVLINLLLRNYLHYKLYDQASKLVSKTTFPEAASNNQLIRYMYYKGRIQAVQLQYSDAYASLMQALRKAPETAIAFRRIVQKVAVIVQLLMGDIPERSVFHADKTLAVALTPYFDLTSAVRSGELAVFARVLSSRKPIFEKDDTLNLILRLEANVIKTGLRSIATSYSKISFEDIARKLALESAEDAECLCAKAIRDGVIDCVLDNAEASLLSNEVANVYDTKEPQEAFHRRITFCLDVHNEAIRAMRYPPHARRGDLEDAEERAEREKEEAELAKEIEDGDLDDEEM